MTLQALVRKLHKAELVRLREHCNELVQQLDAMTVERDAAVKRADYAEDLADSWRDDVMRLAQSEPLGLTQGGSIVRT